MSQSGVESTANGDKKMAAMDGEVQRLRRLCLKLLDEQSAQGQSLSHAQADEIKASLRSAWEELDRKQGYLEGAVAEIESLKAQLADLQSQQGNAGDIATLTASLHEAWAEIDRKQSYLEASVAQSQALQNELDALRAK